MSRSQKGVSMINMLQPRWRNAGQRLWTHYRANGRHPSIFRRRDTAYQSAATKVWIPLRISGRNGQQFSADDGLQTDAFTGSLFTWRQGGS